MAGLPPTVRIEVTRGCPTPDELAVVAVLLLTRAAAAARGAGAGRPAAGATWRPDAFEPSHSWHSRP
jgi:hypothetical protein